jgi:Tol biopolymer transport system component
MDGTGLKQLTDNSYRNRFPRWSADGKTLVFGSNRSGSQELYVVNADGSNLRGPLTDTPGLLTTVGIWSPDSTKIATDEPSACIFDADTTWTEKPPQMLPPIDESGELMFNPDSWSPDGTQLAGQVLHYRGLYSNGIAIYSFETKQYRRLTDFGGWAVWLSDSRRLLFTTSSRNDSNIVYILDSQTGKYHEILSDEILNIAPDRIDYKPAISSDDRYIFYERIRDESDIWMLTLNEEEK